MPRQPITQPINVLIGDKVSFVTEENKRRVNFRESRRQIFQRKKGGFINFWDLGQEADGHGGWADFGFHAPLSSADGVVPPSTGLELFSPQSNWTAMTDVINAIPRDTWKTHFRKVDYDNGHRFGIDIINGWPTEVILDEEFDASYPAAKNGTRQYTDAFSRGAASHVVAATKWIPTGLKLKAEDLPRGSHLWGFNAYGILGYFDAAGVVSDFEEFSTYFTHTYNPADARVTFDILAGNTNIYIVPMLMTHGFIDSSDIFGGGGTYFMVGPAMTLNREVFFNLDMNDGPGHGYPYFSPRDNEQNNGAILSAIDCGWGTSWFDDQLVNWVENAPGTKWYHQDPDFPFTITEISNPGRIWQAYYSNLTHLEGMGWNMISDASMDGFVTVGTTHHPSLVAIIEQKGQWYYMWTMGLWGTEGRIITRY